MSNRRDFLKTAAFAALGSGMAINHVFAGGNDAPSLFNVNSRAGVTPKMKLRFFPYELKLADNILHLLQKSQYTVHRA
jgi:L-Ala-D/L-Glu epimerase